MMRAFYATILAFGILESAVFANPYPDPNVVPKGLGRSLDFTETQLSADERIDALRVQVGWNSAANTFEIAKATLEPSGTSALLKRSLHPSTLGSYRGILVDAATGKDLYFDSIGTGKEFQYLTRSITFRFPVPQRPVRLRFIAENSNTGKLETLWERPLTISPYAPPQSSLPEVKLLKSNARTDKLLVNFYAEGYVPSRREAFFDDAGRALQGLIDHSFPGIEFMEFRAVFAPSKTALGPAQKLGFPIKTRDSFLSLYFPYWRDFGRWYHVVYATNEEVYRSGIGQVAYDYPIILVDDSNYWGVGNFNEITAVPASDSSFIYVLLHEFGHYFGLNEEYEGGGRTELEFAPKISEPWSQNITFSKDRNELKWKKFVLASTEIPTNSSKWTGNGPYGAYRGGYADSEPQHHSHKPGLACTMERDMRFCPICQDAIRQKINFDLGALNDVQ